MDDTGTELIEDKPFIISGITQRTIAPAEDDGRSPRNVNHSARAATIGVLPVPPAVRLPMLTTGTAARCDRKRRRSKARFRMRTAAP